MEEEGLEIDDLMNVLRIINTATDRGAFKANELSFVGKVYDKFAAFVKVSQAAMQEQASAPDPEPEPTPAPAPKKTRSKKATEPADGGEFDE